MVRAKSVGAALGSLWLLACSAEVPQDFGAGGGDNAQGGAVSGASGVGGASPSGGRLGSGGISAGGAPGAGGAFSAGGASSSGGANSAGSPALGGASSSGGANSGGTLGFGGATQAGGASARGGQAGASSGGASSGGSAGNAAGGKASGGSGGVGSGACPYTGNVSYTLQKSATPTSAEQDAYQRIAAAMDKAIQYYNCYTNITKQLRVSYVPSVQTADGNINGSMRFGSNTTYMDYRTAMHEIGHTVGVGQASNWGSFIKDGIFTGSNATQELKAINATLSKPLYEEVHADSQHFWPYGINQQSEVKSEADLLFHCRIVMALRKDLGLN